MLPLIIYQNLKENTIFQDGNTEGKRDQSLQYLQL